MRPCCISEREGGQLAARSEPTNPFGWEAQLAISNLPNHHARRCVGAESRYCAKSVPNAATTHEMSASGSSFFPIVEALPLGQGYVAHTLQGCRIEVRKASQHCPILLQSYIDSLMGLCRLSVSCGRTSGDMVIPQVDIIHLHPKCY